MDSKYLIVFVTATSVEEGRKIARMLVSERLAACVNILPGVTSIYTWEAEICEDGEVLLIIKTRANLIDALSATVNNLHSYDTPEVIAAQVTAGSQTYLKWIDEVTRQL